MGKIIDNHVRFYNGPQINGNRNKNIVLIFSVLETNHHSKLNLVICHTAISSF